MTTKMVSPPSRERISHGKLLFVTTVILLYVNKNLKILLRHRLLFVVVKVAFYFILLCWCSFQSLLLIIVKFVLYSFLCLRFNNDNSVTMSSDKCFICDNDFSDCTVKVVKGKWIKTFRNASEKRWEKNYSGG